MDFTEKSFAWILFCQYIARNDIVWVFTYVYLKKKMHLEIWHKIFFVWIFMYVYLKKKCIWKFDAWFFSVNACACTHTRYLFASKLTVPSAVIVAGSIQHLDQQVSPSSTATLTHPTDLHPLAQAGVHPPAANFPKTLHIRSCSAELL